MRALKSVFMYIGLFLSAVVPVKAEPKPSTASAYDFEFTSIDGEPMPLSAYKGKVVLLVNTASKCGFTPQYKALESLYQNYKDKGLVIIGVPSNDFGGQEPGSNTDIKAFCELNYGVTFPITSKYTVTGKEAHPLYGWLHEVLGGLAAPKWNFHKYIIDRHGKPVTYFSSLTAPDAGRLIEAVETALKAE